MMMKSVPVVEGAGSLCRYLAEIRQFPLLDPQEEYCLAVRWRSHGDIKAAHKLVTSHLRLVVKVAMGYRGYGLPINEVVSEGNIGLMQAVKRFDPDRGFRLATYAVWWIKAAIQEYVLRSWSLVKLGTTSSQKKLFFNLRRIKGQISAFESGELLPEHVDHIATKLGVEKRDVVSMNSRLAGDISLNAPLRNDLEGGCEWQDTLVDDVIGQEEKLLEKESATLRHALLSKALSKLNDRERRIFEARRLNEPPLTLAELSEECQISRERVRQIEARVLEKIQKDVLLLQHQEGSVTA